jgi:hypothetical protein
MQQSMVSQPVRWSSRRTKLALVLAGVAIVGIAAAASADGSHARGARTRVGSSRLSVLEAQHQQLESQLGQCVPQLQAALQQQAAASMNGQFYTGEPACAAYMAGWTAELAMVEKQIYQLQTGANVPVTEFASSSSSSAAPSSDNSDRALDAVDRYDRNAIRGTGNYTDETGETRELPLAPNYWRDHASGDITSTETPDAPADGRDWQRMQPEE